MPVILVAETEGKTRRMLRRFLEGEGLEARTAATLPETRAILSGCRAAALLTGLGPDALRELRRGGSTLPAVAILPADTLAEKARHLEAGADWWLPRPVDPEEALLLLRALLRRCGEEPAVPVALGPLWLEERTRELHREEQAAALTPREYELLALLLSHPRRIYTRQELLDRLWDPNTESGLRAVDVAVRRLRARCGRGWGFEIQAVRGLGYRLVLTEGTST